MRNVVVPPARRLTVTQSCARGERLVGEQHALAFQTPVPPPVEVLDDVHATRNRYAADLVTLVTERMDQYAGRGYVNSTRTSGTYCFSIVKRAVEAHRGTIALRSVPGVETVFTIRVPHGM